jgi:hypothetical protein
MTGLQFRGQTKKFSMTNSKRAATDNRVARQIRVMPIAVAVVLMLCTFVIPVQSRAQNQTDDTRVEVLVADQSEKQRSSAYWLALDRVLRRNMPDAVTDPDQRAKVLREASRYVQSFRYRRYDAAADGSRLATRAVREGAEPDSVIVVTFPNGLEGILREQTAPVAVVETEEVLSEPTDEILALVAVDQESTQFLIGGNRGKKFQSRMIQLGASNSLAFQFPALDRSDNELITAADVLFDQTDKMNSIMPRYETNRRLSVSLFRLSEQVWQTEWRYVVGGQIVQTLNLSTRTLDEALVTALSELGGTGGGYRADSYLAPTGAFQRDGVELRVENINSIGAYQRIYSALKQVEPTLVTEALEADAVVFRAPQATLSNLQQSLARVPDLGELALGPVGTALVARYVGR